MDVHKIAFLTDLSGGETRAYRTAAMLARRLGALLQLVHVVELGGRCLRWAEEQLNVAARREAAFRSVHVQTITLGGRDTYGLLADFTRDVQLVVCAHSAVEADGFRGERLLPERLVEACEAPLLVLPRDDALASRREARGSYRVLIPHDLYETPDAYLDVCEALSRGAPPISCCFYRRPEAPACDPYGPDFAGHRQPAEAPDGEEAAAEEEDDSVHVLLGSGPAGRELVKNARALDVHLVVVCPGTEGARPGLPAEDVSWVLRHAPCGVLVVRAPVGPAATSAVEAGYELYCG